MHKQRRALVTGGSGDIGQAICKRLAADGVMVYVHAHRRPERAEAVASAICDAEGNARAVTFNVTDEAACQATLAELLQDGPIQILVNNAGLHDDAIMAGMAGEQWRRVVDVNLNGFFNVTQPLLLPMMQIRWGRIVNLSSIAGVLGNRGQTNYAAAKAGIIGATRSLAQEMASRGITVNAVAPGIIEGEITEGVFDADRIREMVPMRRVGRAEEVADLVGFLCSDQAGYISAQVIGINGAMA